MMIVMPPKRRICINFIFPGVEIKTKCYPWNFSPISNVIVTQLTPGITVRQGWLKGNKWEGHPVDTRSIPVFGVTWVTTGWPHSHFLFVTLKSPLSLPVILGKNDIQNRWKVSCVTFSLNFYTAPGIYEHKYKSILWQSADMTNAEIKPQDIGLLHA